MSFSTYFSTFLLDFSFFFHFLRNFVIFTCNFYFFKTILFMSHKFRLFFEIFSWFWCFFKYFLLFCQLLILFSIIFGQFSHVYQYWLLILSWNVEKNWRCDISGLIIMKDWIWFYVEGPTKIMDVWSWPINSGLWPWINFTIFSWNVEEIIWTWSWLILWF